MNTEPGNLFVELQNCVMCPHSCGADRRILSKPGYCNSGIYFGLGSVCIHKGEEPPVSGKNGICNVFFTHCNLQCIYCQNHQISNNYHPSVETILSLEEVAQLIFPILDMGIHAVGFVSASHMVPQTISLVKYIRAKGYSPVFIYNTNAYDTVDSLKLLEPYIDVYLPDFKYYDDALAFKLSGVNNYSGIALKAIKEMYRQKGSVLHVDDNGQAVQGIIIRHLVLPGEIQNSIDVLRIIAEEISTSVHLSIMAQYNPVYCKEEVRHMNRHVLPSEYQRVCDVFELYGFRNGFIQELSSNESYNPNFLDQHPFE